MSAVQRAQRAGPSGPQGPKSGTVSGARTFKSTASSKALKSLTRVSGRWLRWQCQLLSDVRFAAVIDATDLAEGAGVTPNNIISQVGSPEAPLIVAGSVQQHQQSSQQNLSLWQVPINFPGRTLCVMYHIGSLGKQEQAAVDRLLRWGVLSLSDWLSDAQASPAPSMPPLQLMLGKKNLDQAAASWVDDLQSKTGAARVSVGWFENGSTRLLAISGVVGLDTRRTLPRALSGALGESVKAGTPILYPQKSAVSNADSATELTQHRTVHEHVGDHRLFSVPLMLENSALGAILMELKPSQNAATVNTIVMDEVALATPVLATLSERKPGPAVLVSRVFNRLRTALFNPATKTQKMVTASFIVLGLIALLFPFSYSASVRGEIQGADRQVLAAAHTGYLKSASARAGDSVTSGQVLAKFDHTQLKLERDTWVSELTRIDAALVQAMSARNRSVVGSLRAEQAAANAEVELIDHRIAQSDIVAPFDGILVRGDLDDRLGSAVETGESLFQIASLNNYTLQLDVPEQHAAKIQQGSTGKMRFAAFPSEAFSFSVDSMVPVAIPEDGANIFRMQASLSGDTDKIRPGMTGVAKVTIGSRPWLLRVVDFASENLRYWWWSFGA